MGTRQLSAVMMMLGTLAVPVMSACSSSAQQPSDVTPPTLSQINPTSSPVGTVVTIQGSGFASTNNAVKFGDGYIRGLSSSNGSTIQFTVPEGLDMCPPDAQGPCAGANPQVRPGDYMVAVISQGKSSSAVKFTVTAK